MQKPQSVSDFLVYLAESSQSTSSSNNGSANSPERIPSLTELSKELGVSISVLREQLEVAKALGLVDVRPRTGIRRLPYSFFPAVSHSLTYALSADPAHFMEFADLRNHLEAAYWDQAVRNLLAEDKEELQSLLTKAREKLHGRPIQIPHAEHRQLHMAIYRRLNNPFVLGILEAYWQAYEAVGLSLYADYDYLKQVWQYHEQMVDAICSCDFDAGLRALEEHKDLLHAMPVPGAGYVSGV